MYAIRSYYVHVIDRVVAGLRFGQIKIEVHVLLALAHDIEETRGVVADFLAQLAQGDELTGAGRHLHLGAAAV